MNTCSQAANPPSQPALSTETFEELNEISQVPQEKQDLQGFFRTDKGSTPTFHPRTEIRMATPTSRNQKPKEPSKPSTPIRKLTLKGSFPKPWKPWAPTEPLHSSAFLIFPSKPPISLTTGATPLLPQWQNHPTQQTQTYSGPLTWRLLFAKCLKLFSKRRSLPICPNFHY